MSRLSWYVLTMLLLIGIGCRQDSEISAPDAPADTDAAQVVPENKTPADAETAAGDDPAAQLTTIRNHLIEGRSDPIVAAIPQAWLDEPAVTPRHWIGIDPQARTEFLTAIARAARAIDAKAEWIAGSEVVVFDGPWAKVLDNNLASLARATAAIAQWPGWLATGEFDAAGMTSAIVAALAAEPTLVKALGQLEFETVSVTDEIALVRYRGGDDRGWETFPVTRREGVWLPARLLEEWERTAPVESSNADHAERLRQLAGRLNDLSDRLEPVSSQAEFDAIAEQAAKDLLAEQPHVDSAPRAVAEEEFAWVVVSGSMSDDELDQLLWNVASRTDAPASAIADARAGEDGNSVRIHVGPVADLRAFAWRLTGLVIENIDEKQRTITARLGRDRSP